MHIPNETKVLFVPRSLAYCLSPFFDRLEYSVLDPGGADGGPLWKAPDQFIEEFFGADLQMKGIPAIFDANIQQLPPKLGNTSQVGAKVGTVRARRDTLGFR